jgi:hypothetical protein
VLHWSCTAINDLPVDPVSESNEQSVTFTVRMPNASPQSYAMNAQAESDIQAVDVLAFRIDNITGDEYYDYRASGAGITDLSTNEKRFTVTLLKNDTTHYRLVFLANVKDELDALTLSKGALKEPLLRRLLSHTSLKWNVETTGYTPFPMWGESGALMIDNNLTSLTGITLLRSVASIEVYADAAAVTSVFTLEDVYLYNRKIYGRVAPDGIKYDAVNKKVTAPTMPTVNMTEPLNVLGPLHYTVTSTAHKLDSTIYTYEAEAVALGDDFSATCLVVGGTYTPLGIKQYYRLDFVTRDVNGNFEEYRPLLRNHRYQFIINSVTGDGHNSPERAFYDKKGNMGVEILTWNLADMNNVVVKEVHHLSLNRSKMEVAGIGVFYVGVETNHPDGWSATATDTWFSVSSQSGYMKITVNSNAPINGRTGYILVTAGNMTKKFELKQNSL